MKKVQIFLVALFGIIFLAGCSHQTVQVEPTSPDSGKIQDAGSIKVGVISPLAGGAAVYGEDSTHAYNYIVDTINAAGGIDGRQVELIYEDGKCGGKEATAAVQKLINVDGVQVILGGVCSSETIPAGKIAQQAGVVMISATASSPEVSEIGDYMFRYWNDLDAGGVMAEYLASNGAENIVIIMENNDYSINYTDVVKDNFAGEIIMETKVNPDEKDLSIVAKQLSEVAADADYIVFVAVTESLNKGMLQAFENEGILETLSDRIIGGEALLVDTVLAELGSALDGVKTMVLSDDLGEDVALTMAALKEGYEVQSSDVFVMLWADAADLAMDALAEVGNDADAVRDYISGFTAENPREALIGDFYFDAEGDGQGIEFVVKEAKGGELVLVE